MAALLIILQLLTFFNKDKNADEKNGFFQNADYGQAVAVNAAAGGETDNEDNRQNDNISSNAIDSNSIDNSVNNAEILSGAADKQEQGTEGTDDWLCWAVSMLTGLDLFDGESRLQREILTACLPWDFSEAAEDDAAKLVFNYAAGDESSYFWNQNDISEEPQVAIYSTHSAESYTPYSGQASVSGERGGVYVASSVVAEALAKKNIGTVVDDTIHDSPNWNLSYKNSLQTASRLLNEYPSVRILIDMHRDAGLPKEKTTVEINGKKAAGIMLVVGSNQRYEHPYWQENLAFAESIGEKMQEMYPGLLRAVKVQNGRYNQHISTHSILVEMGATDNTIEEVEYSAAMLADVLAAVLEQMD